MNNSQHARYWIISPAFKVKYSNSTRTLNLRQLSQPIVVKWAWPITFFNPTSFHPSFLFLVVVQRIVTRNRTPKCFSLDQSYYFYFCWHSHVACSQLVSFLSCLNLFCTSRWVNGGSRVVCLPDGLETVVLTWHNFHSFVLPPSSK